jgi:hypothetical protein
LESEAGAKESNRCEVILDVKQIDLKAKENQSQKGLAGYVTMVENRKMGADFNTRHSCRQPFKNLSVDKSKNREESKASD